uniref:DinB family protein n=1 Tax=Promineifilum sp. TaxID=2664178 RepID=UPI0035ADAA00
DRFETLYKAIEAAVAGLPAAALDWKPGPEMNSIAVILAHTAGAWRYWVGDVAGGQPSGRVRADEFETRDVDAAEMLGRLRAALDTGREVLAALDPATLGETRTAGMFDEQRTVGWALLHALEHTALHAGHIQLTRQLWDEGIRN